MANEQDAFSAENLRMQIAEGSNQRRLQSQLAARRQPARTEGTRDRIAAGCVEDYVGFENLLAIGSVDEQSERTFAAKWMSRVVAARQSSPSDCHNG